MTKPRSQLVDSDHPRYYHVASRCVRRAWLLGKDPLTGVDHSHRKNVFLNRVKHLAQFFALEIMGYAIMSNHFHLVVHYDPLEKYRWSDEEVAERWCRAFHGKSITDFCAGSATLADFDLDQTIRYHSLLLDPERLTRCRNALGSLSRFMQHLKQPFAVWVNHEEGCKGHLFESRFYSGVLLTEEDLLACMAYVDLNPVEAGIARSLGEAIDTSVYERLNSIRFDADQLDNYLAPLWTNPRSQETPSTNTQATRIPVCTLKEYAEQLNLAISYLTHPHSTVPSKVKTWIARLINRKRSHRRSASVFFDYA